MPNHCRNLWQHRSHVLAPLAKFTSQNMLCEWEKEWQKALEETKRVTVKETILAFPEFSELLHAGADTSDTALGAVVMQLDNPLLSAPEK